jgi:hypothetical protein
VVGAAPDTFNGPVIPSDWVSHRRSADAELVGYLRRDASGTTPLNLFGHPLAGPGEPAWAVAVLEARGLASLAEAWWLRHPDEAVEVRIVETSPDRVHVVEAPFGFYGPDSPRHTLETPATTLSPRP